MGRLSRIVALAFALLFAMVPAAFADHMNGTYTGTGTAAGTTLRLQQQDRMITGDFSGTLNGSFYGQTDGGDYAEGYLTDGMTTYTYFLNWSREQLLITLYDTAGNQVMYAFTQNGGGGAQPATKIDVPPPANFYVAINGAQQGPFTLEQVIAKITAGEIGRDTLVWQPGQAAWTAAKDMAALAGSLPPEPPPVVRYFVVAAGQQVGPLTLDEVIARIENGSTVGTDLAWKDGQEAWAPASTFEEFAEALTPEPAPPPPPPPPPEVPEDNPPPPPPVDTPPPPPEDTPPPAPEGTTPPAPEETSPPAPEETTPPAPEETTPPAPEETAPPAPEETAPPAPEETAPPSPEEQTPPPAPEESTPVPAPAVDTSDAALSAAFAEFVAGQMASAPAETQAAIVECGVAAMAPLTPEERSMVLAQKFDLSDAVRALINGAHPELASAMDDCIALGGDAGGGGSSSSSSVSLPDGRTLVVVSDSGSASVSSVDGGYELGMGDKMITFVNGELTVDGVAMDVPAFTSKLEIKVENGNVTLKAD